MKYVFKVPGLKPTKGLQLDRIMTKMIEFSEQHGQEDPMPVSFDAALDREAFHLVDSAYGPLNELHEAMDEGRTRDLDEDAARIRNIMESMVYLQMVEELRLDLQKLGVLEDEPGDYLVAPT